MIHRSDTSHTYAPSDYDEDMCLKPPLFLWLALIYLCRGILLPMAIGVGHFAGVNADAMTMLRDYWNAIDLIPSEMAVPVLFALFRRSASASKPTRWIWGHGKILIALAAVADLLAAGAPLLRNREASDELIVSIIKASIDVYFLMYVLYARRARDTFLDFPPPPPSRS